VVSFEERGDKEPAYRAIHRFFDLAVSGALSASMPARNDFYFNAQYLADGLTRQQCALFDSAVRFAASHR
jgi:hypothetical protein